MTVLTIGVLGTRQIIEEPHNIEHILSTMNICT